MFDDDKLKRALRSMFGYVMDSRGGAEWRNTREWDPEYYLMLCYLHDFAFEEEISEDEAFFNALEAEDEAFFNALEAEADEKTRAGIRAGRNYWRQKEIA